MGDSLLHIKDRKSSMKSVKHSRVNWYWATLPLLFLTKDLLPYSSHSHHWKFSVSSGCLFPPLVLLCQLSKMLPRKTESLIQRYLFQSFQTEWIKTCHRKMLVCYLSLNLWALHEPLTCWIVWKIKAHNVVFPVWMKKYPLTWIVRHITKGTFTDAIRIWEAFMLVTSHLQCGKD